MTTHLDRAGDLPAWHSTFSASAQVATATVHARGTLDLFTVDLLQGAIDVLTTAGCTDIVLDLADVSSIDHAAAWCIADTSARLTSRHGRLAVLNARDDMQAMLGNLERAPRAVRNAPAHPELRRTPSHGPGSP